MPLSIMPVKRVRTGSFALILSRAVSVAILSPELLQSVERIQGGPGRELIGIDLAQRRLELAVGRLGSARTARGKQRQILKQHFARRTRAVLLLKQCQH